jgi:hypothetical protein
MPCDTAQSFDSFTIDEAYHIAAGVSYTKYHDFRINPEHPPLVKLWVGGIVQATGFRLDALHQSSEKEAERSYTERAVFRQNDPDSVQVRAYCPRNLMKIIGRKIATAWSWQDLTLIGDVERVKLVNAEGFPRMGCGPWSFRGIR